MRFKLKIFGDVDNPDDIILKDSCGQPLASFESLDDARLVRDLLNEQHETIIQLQSANMEMEDYLARLEEENEQLKQENKKLHDRIFAMRTNEALDRTLISEKDWKNPREFLEDLDLW